MNILICDDVQSESAQLESIIKASGLETNIINFSSSLQALAHIKSGAKIDICFLDILMPEMNGTELAAHIREINCKSEIIFLSTSNEYAMESYKVAAFSYILKPPQEETVKDILNNIVKAKQNADTAGLTIITRRIARFLYFHEISYIEVIQHKIFFRLINGLELETNKSLNEMLPLFLSDNRFAQCHRSYVLNMNAISYIQDRDIILKSGHMIPISKSFPGFKKQYINWIFGGSNFEKQ